jgi:hypothetical protein
LIRGGWYDRNGVYFSDGVDGNGLKSVNIISKGKIDTKIDLFNYAISKKTITRTFYLKKSSQ